VTRAEWESRPLVSDPTASPPRYAWRHSRPDGTLVEFASEYHPTVPFACSVHGWWSSAPCRACLGDPPFQLPLRGVA
jgi:hypothetical protein